MPLTAVSADLLTQDLSENGAFEASFAGPRFSLILDRGIPECGTEQ